MYHEDIFYPILPMFSTFDGKMVIVVENAECFHKLPLSDLPGSTPCPSLSLIFTIDSIR